MSIPHIDTLQKHALDKTLMFFGAHQCFSKNEIVKLGQSKTLFIEKETLF